MASSEFKVERESAAGPYVRKSLRKGLHLARVCEPETADWYSYAVVPIDADPRYHADFRYGRNRGQRLDGTGSGIRKEVVASWLIDQFPECHLVIEIPMEKPSDPHVDLSAPNLLVCGEELFEHCPPGSGIEEVTLLLLAHIPQWGYHVFGLKLSEGSQLEGCPADLVEAGLASVQFVLVGAYDGEGFALLTREKPKKTVVLRLGMGED